jgi:methyl-accepting chemotaxis protein
MTIVSTLESPGVPLSDDEAAVADFEALMRVMAELGAAQDVEGVTEAATRAVREAFGWDYGCYWRVDEAHRDLRVEVEAGSLSTGASQASCRRGEGLPGKAWETGELVYLEDIGALNTERERALRAGGYRSGLALPVMVDQQVSGALEFLGARAHVGTAQLLAALRCVGLVINQVIERIRTTSAEKDAAAEMASRIDGVVALLTEAASATTETLSLV